jgi:hypothetical protein
MKALERKFAGLQKVCLWLCCSYMCVITSLAVCCRLNCTVQFSIEGPEGLICLLVAVVWNGIFFCKRNKKIIQPCIINDC